ncbi:MAG TPA: preprotein translocase subunit YajC [Nocardioidaceae bacterium]|nr:preprotein translocase subunit YajC [Nocardioidaceae bacterium]
MSSGDLASILPLVLIVLAFWFLVIRPARKRQQDMARTQSSAQVGTRVMLGSGIYGTVTALADDTVELEVAPGTVLTVARQAIVRVIDAPQGLSAHPAADEPASAAGSDAHDESDPQASDPRTGDTNDEQR